MQSQQVFHDTRQHFATEGDWYHTGSARIRWKSRVRLWGFLSFMVWLNSGGLGVAQQLQWARGVGGIGGDSGQDIAVDGNGNSYVTGGLAGMATFGAGEPNETTLTSVDIFGDIFIAKYDSNGQLVWAKRAGGGDGDTGIGIAVDGNGNSYVTGQFKSTATFGAGEPNETTLNSAGQGDIVIAKYDSNGQLVWAKRAGAGGVDLGNGIVVDGSGNSYVTGVFSNTVTFGAGEPNETILTSTAGIALFVARYNNNGQLVWAKQGVVGEGGNQGGRRITIDGSGNIYVIGSFFKTAIFGSGEANETTLISNATSNGGVAIFVARYNNNGQLVWAKQGLAVEGANQGLGIAVDGNGNSYVTGYIFGMHIFGPGEPNETTLVAAGNSGRNDIVIAKYNSNGQLLWAKRAGGEESDTPGGIAVDGNGNSYVAGYFNGTSTFGPGEPNETTLTSDGNFDDLFIAQFDTNGQLLWAGRDGGEDSNNSLAIAVDGNGNSYVTGQFYGTVILGAGQPNETTLTSAGGTDMYVIRYSAVCGDGLIRGTEACDLGAANGAADACCTASCTFVAADTTCRPSAGACDIAESCTGTDAECPADAKSTAVCRPSAGVCDVAESCDGVNNACPSDAFASAATVCRPSADQCDAAESCSGSGATCPADGFQPNGTTCNDGNPATSDDVCTNGVCAGSVVPLALLTPNGGETWPIGGTQTLQWNPSGVSGQVKIELSRNNGATWEVLFKKTPNDGTQTWTVAGLATSQALVRVSSVNTPGIADTSNAVFSIGGGSVTVLSPNGGETWTIGSTRTIQWSSSGLSGKVKIELSLDGGATWTKLFNNEANTGSKTWKVKKPATTQARIRVSGVDDPSAVDASNANFTIQ